MSEQKRIPKQKRSAVTRNSILDAAFELFSSKGFNRTSSLDIATRAEISVGCLYSYFNNKKEILLEVLDRYNQAFFDQFAAALKSFEPGAYGTMEFIANLINSVNKAHSALNSFHNELIVMIYSDRSIAKIMVAQKDRIVEEFYKYLNLWKPYLRVADLKTASLVIYDLIDKAIDSVQYCDNKEQADKIAYEISSMLACYLFGAERTENETR